MLPPIGLINALKPPGMSSHEVVACIRRIVGMKRVGHTGTLDPCAAGVLPILLGHACRLADYVAAGPKSYRAEILLGVTTDSADAEGPVTAETDASALREEDVRAALPQFIGLIRQQPPVRSAIWVDGQRAYNRTLKGQDIEMPTREITVHAFTPARFLPGPRARLLADITVSKGAYIRSLAADLGSALGVGGTLGVLIRTQVGHCRLRDAVTLEELAAGLEAGDAARYILSPDVALPHIPALNLPPDAYRYQWGTWIESVGGRRSVGADDTGGRRSVGADDTGGRRSVGADTEGEDGLFRIYLDGRFLGLGSRAAGILQPVVNMQGPPA